MTLKYKLDIDTLKDDLDKCNLVFTYGTLKLGYGNDRILTRHEAQYKGSVRTKEKYAMGTSGCPFIFPVSVCEAVGGLEEEYYAPVRGDLWEIPDTECFASLDMLEGHPSFYTRTTIIIVDNEGNEQEAWAYEQLSDYWMYNCSVVKFNEDGEYEW